MKTEGEMEKVNVKAVYRNELGTFIKGKLHAGSASLLSERGSGGSGEARRS